VVEQMIVEQIRQLILLDSLLQEKSFR